MSTNAVTSAGSTTASSAYGKAAGSVLGKDDFLKLLVTQLQHQDPMNPMEDTAYISQLAQFSTLEQMQNMGSSIDSMTKATTTGQAFTMVGAWIDYVNGAGEIVTGKVDSVSIVDGQAKLRIGETEIGLDSIRQVYPGIESFGKAKSATQALQLLHSSIDYVDSTGMPTSGKVDWVSFVDGWPVLNVGDQKVTLGDILSAGASSSGVDDAANQVRMLVGLKVDYISDGSVVTGRVDGITTDAGGTHLTVGDKIIDVSDVAKVY